MSVTAPESASAGPWRRGVPGRRVWSPARRLIAGSLPLALVALLAACAEEPLPQRRISHDDCLAEVKLDQLREAIARCDKVVAAFPRDPLPLNERFLLHTLAEDDAAACRDIVQADALARRVPPGRLDGLMRRDLARRLADCRTSPPPATPARRPAAASAGTTSSPPIQKLPDKNR